VALLYGYILSWGGYSTGSEAQTFPEQFATALLKHDSFSADTRGGSRVNPAWRGYWLSSKKALHDHGLSASSSDQASAIRDATYTYPFMVRVNAANGTIIIVSKLYDITDAVVDEFNYRNKPNLKRKVVDVQKVSQALLDETRNREYSITYFLADVPGYGSNLRSITLYGNDIAEAEFLKSERKNFSARKIGVRPFNASSDAGRFNNFGTVQFRSEHINVFEDFLRFAYQNNLFIE